MHSFFKKRKSDDSNPQPPAKRERLSSTNSEPSHLCGSPKVVAAWNCNGLTSRLRSADDAQQIKAFVTEYKPDVFFLSEVRLPAANNSSHGKPGSNTKWFRSRIKESDKKSLEDAVLVRNFFNSSEFVDYKIFYSLADTKYAGTAMLLNTRTTKPPKSIRYNVDQLDVKATIHDSQGRIIVAKFAEFSILHTYSPNNGWEESHFKRRREWDEKIRSFMKRKKEAGVRIMWIGDLNVAPRDEDLSHPAYFRRQKGIKQVISPEDIGQPGCTDRERKSLHDIMEGGNLLDAFRELVGNEDSSTFTWRGNSSDIESVKVTGIEEDQAGFMGSDHCPVVVSITERSVQDNSAAQPGGQAKKETHAHDTTALTTLMVPNKSQ